ncbi:septum site-determining protein MinC [Armatimonas sp.]|uniref:septum site-determining protein MinC n=1 Tax=Armatimonas sp. TaxID=1872638 RepID=UPI00286C438F|nr:septum site-determining protein MinC [Armatimonas sp.]
MQELEIKGWRNGLLIVLPEADNWDGVRSSLEARLNEAKDARTFWRGAQVTLDFGNRELSLEAVEELCSWLREFWGLIPLAAVAPDPQTQAACEKLVLKTYEVLPTIQKATADREASEQPAPQMARPAPPSSELNNALYLFRSVRSGQRIEHSGNLVICGDVSADAEVVATGDIIVVGKLRGRPHAGCQGDESAKIVASELRAPQLRIAGKIAAAPHEEGLRTEKRSAEVARIENGEIHVFPL